MSQSVDSSLENAGRDHTGNGCNGEKAILVLGTSSSGKSTFVNWVAESFEQGLPSQGRRVGIRNRMTAKTHEVEAVPLRLPDDAPVSIVDTPGLEHTHLSNAEVFLKLGNWLEDSFKRGIRVGAIVYLLDISREWISTTTHLDFELLGKLCGARAVGAGVVTIVTTHWEEVSPEEGSSKEAELLGVLFSKLGPEAREHLAVRKVSDRLGAEKLVLEIFPTLKDSNHVLSIQHELLGRRLPLDMTEAGRCFTLAPKPEARPKRAWYRASGKAARYEPIDSIIESGCGMDIVFAVMGLTKAGKSTLINELIGYEGMEIGRDMVSCTKNIEAVVIQKPPEMYLELFPDLNGRRIVLLDTPGFDDTEISDYEVLTRIAKWLEFSHRKGMPIGGVLYLHDVTKDVFSGTAKVNIEVFAKICGSEAMEKVAFLTTKWSHIAEGQLENAASRVIQLRRHWKALTEKGATISHLQPPSQIGLPDGETVANPWELLAKLVRRQGHCGYVRLQHELVERKRVLGESEAGKQVIEDLGDLLKKHRENRSGERSGSQQEIEGLQEKLKGLRPGLSQRLMGWTSRMYVPFGL